MTDQLQLIWQRDLSNKIKYIKQQQYKTRLFGENNNVNDNHACFDFV